MHFDGIRVDEDNVDADLLQVYTNYFRAAFAWINLEANALAHISILEAWDLNDNAFYNQNMMVQPCYDNLSLCNYGCTLWIGFHKDLITSSLTDRTNNSKYGDTQANYIFLRVLMITCSRYHSYIVSKENNPQSDGYTP